MDRVTMGSSMIATTASGNVFYDSGSGVLKDVSWHTWVSDDVATTEKIKGGSDMMGLYDVYVVNTKEKTVHNERVFAREDSMARVKALRTANPSAFPDDDVEIIVVCLGQWEDKKPKDVRIVK